jgi:hypothetical protein
VLPRVLQNNATQKDDTLRAHEARGKHQHVLKPDTALGLASGSPALRLPAPHRPPPAIRCPLPARQRHRHRHRHRHHPSPATRHPPPTSRETHFQRQIRDTTECLRGVESPTSMANLLAPCAPPTSVFFCVCFSLPPSRPPTFLQCVRGAYYAFPKSLCVLPAIVIVVVVILDAVLLVIPMVIVALIVVIVVVVVVAVAVAVAVVVIVVISLASHDSQCSMLSLPKRTADSLDGRRRTQAFAFTI